MHVADSRTHNALQQLTTIRDRIAAFFDRLTDTWVGTVFGADLRSLAIFRVCLGLIVFFDMANRIQDFNLWFTEDGLVPRDLLLTTMSDWRWSLFLITKADSFQWFLLLVGMISSLMVVFGYRTRLMLVVMWALLYSMQMRNPLILSGADTLIRLVAFWSMLLPLGAVWSVDAAREEKPTPLSTRFLSFATFGFLGQIIVMYLFTVILKDGPAWRGDGTALYYSTGARQITRPFGEWLHQFPDMLRVFTHIGLGIEFFGPLLLLLPFRKGAFRVLGIALIVSLHIGINLIMDVAYFPYTSSLVMVAFLPEGFWSFMQVRIGDLASWLERRRPQLFAPPSLLPELSPVAGQTAQAARVENPTSSIMLRRFASSLDAFRAPAASSPRVVRRERSGWWLNLFAAFCICFVVAWNIPSVSAFTMPRESLPVAHGLGLYQKWNMFAPNPPNSTVWYVARGYVAGGEAVDLISPFVFDHVEDAVRFSWDEPDDIVNGWYKDKYWRKYLAAIANDNYSSYRKEFAGYVCRTWNTYYGGDAKLETIQYISIRKPTLLDGTDGKESRRLIAEYTCS